MTQVYMKHQTTPILLFNLQQTNLFCCAIVTVEHKLQAEGPCLLGLPLHVHSLFSQTFRVYKRVHCTDACISAYVTAFNLILTYTFLTY